MKRFLVASDIHGSLEALEKTIELMNEFKADKLILLGDIFGTHADEFVEILNGISNKLDIVRGNCDSYFESDKAKFKIFDNMYENINGTLAYLCHGHRLNDMDLAMYGAKIVMMGHVHYPFIRQEQGVIWMCPGSIAAPRNGSNKAFAIIDDEKIQIYNVDKIKLNELYYK